MDIDEALLIAGSARAKARGPFVYFFESAGFIKIGWTSNVSMRLSTCQSGNPSLISIAAVAIGGELEEAILHRHFDHDRHRAEWFVESPSMARLLKRLKGHDPYLARQKLGEWFYRETGSDALDMPVRENRLRPEDV